jgi:hypothetical protein
MKIFEGMWANDLEDLVQPLISIDEYESKIDGSAVVIGFYVGDKDAADDLNRFIQKSAVPLIDSDVSPAPDQRGYYIVFAELSVNDRLGDNLRNICEEVAQIGAVAEWKVKIRGIDGVQSFDPDFIFKAVIKNNMSDRIKKLQSSLTMVKSKLSSKTSPRQ